MQWKTTRKTTEVQLPGYNVTLETVDGTVKVITISDGSDHSLRIQGDYGVSVSVPKPPETEKRWKLSGAVAGLPVEHVFESDWDAQQAKRDYESKVRDEENAKLEIAEVQVPVTD